MPANVQSMVYNAENGAPWHGLGTAVNGMMTAAEAVVKAGLDWKVDKVELFDGDGNKVPNHFSIRRSDNKQSLGVVGNQYTALQNSDAFSFMDAVIQEKLALYETAGALGAGERVWMLAKVDGVMEARSGDMILKYLLLSNTHDGSGKVIICITTVRVVCQNTLNLAIADAASMFKFKHTKNMGNKVVDAREALGIVNKYYKDFEESLKALTARKMSVNGFRDYVKAVGFDVDANAGKAKGQVDELVRLFGEGRGNKGESVWDGLNAVTEYTDWFRNTRVTKTGSFQNAAEARLDTQWFGSGLAIKEKALEVAVGLAA